MRSEDPSSDPLYGFTVDSAGNAYLSGYTGSVNFPTTPGSFDTVLDTGADAFAAKLSTSGSSLVYSTFLGGSGFDAAYAIAVDGSGNAYLTGATKSLNFPTTPGVLDVTFNSTSANDEDAFAVKLNASGSALVYSTYLGAAAAIKLPELLSTRRVMPTYSGPRCQPTFRVHLVRSTSQAMAGSTLSY